MATIKQSQDALSRIEYILNIQIKANPLDVVTQNMLRDLVIAKQGLSNLAIIVEMADSDAYPNDSERMFAIGEFISEQGLD
ncbi:hypothetical protein KNV08_gp110 [Vibrio phage Quinn]|uniref:Uncharacterized protein n=1 Tax=Vibrio phage Quinn TaxID=2736265 RepID=A0A6M9Z3W6_9CAUD|nr:hypothetical protein KNV08_gp002 [Vibrio phage Quinn]YP_010108610.1 hypothetical protein KNV08_gp110 [Vibrio phage Quinn]QKN85244.1 hypothetical protein QUINN_2 [Vibrio phage Quinn]QKN85424.1 hypothetical protein QUINN_204 [Vibrio phage Quinn]